MHRHITDLTNIEANKFFLRNDSYNGTLNLPIYINFEKILNEVSKELNYNIISDSIMKVAKQTDHINHIVFVNKKGKYSWRKLTLIHPFLYVSMVNLITSEDNWNLIMRYFQQSWNGKIICTSMPVVPGNLEGSKSGEQILEWKENFERESIRIGLDYEFCHHADIEDCYGSIYTHSFSWALHGKELAKKKKIDLGLLGDSIDNHCQAISFGQTNGITQGSVLSDFLAEIVLGYVDKLLFEELKLSETFDYKIIRYRDDYRIFTKSIKDGETLLKKLSNVLLENGLNLNDKKTKLLNDHILESIKSDKLETIIFSKTFLPETSNISELRNNLIFINYLCKKYENCPSLKTLLTNLIDSTEKTKFTERELFEFTSILINISTSSLSVLHLCITIISNMIKPFDGKVKFEILDKVHQKLGTIQDSAYIDIWFQRLSLKIKKYEFAEKICKSVIKDSYCLFKNNDWLGNTRYKKIIKCSIVDKIELDKTTPEIRPREVKIFKSKYTPDS